MSSVNKGVCAAIRDYLVAHPGAADSVLGIHQWWLPDSLSHVSLVTLRVVLERMERHGELKRVRLADGQDLYAAPEPAPT